MSEEHDDDYSDELEEFLSVLELDLLQSLAKLDLKELLVQAGEYDLLPNQSGHKREIKKKIKSKRST